MERIIADFLTNIYFMHFNNIEEFNLILDDFNRYVHNKTFEKVHYDTWKKLSSLRKLSDENKILLRYDAEFNVIAIVVNSGYDVFKFLTDDHSFGTFLYQTYFKSYIEKERKLMYNYYDSSGAEILNTNTVNTNYTSTTVTASPTYSNAIKIDTGINDLVGVIGNYDAKTNTTCISDRVDDLEAKISTLETKIEDKNKVKTTIKDKTKKENKTMKGLTFDFGPITSDVVRMSVYGIAVKNGAGTYVSYNSQTGEIIDVDILNFDGSQFMYKVPIGLNAIQKGDVIIHNRKPMIVEGVSGKDVSAVDVMGGERKTIIPTRSPFGFNFITKIVSIMDMMAPQAPSQDAPFGNMLPFLLMNKDDKQDNSGFDFMMLMFMMNGQNAKSMNMMLPFLLTNQEGNNSNNMGLMLAMMMAQTTPTDTNNGFFTPPITINKA